MPKKKSSKKFIQEAIPPSHKGRLHKALGVPEDKKIPEAKLEKATHSKSPKIKKMANLAETLKKLPKPGRKKK